MSQNKQFQDVTSDFENMIQSFAADFELAVNGKNKIAIASKNPRLLHDIEKLSELAFYLKTIRTGRFVSGSVCRSHS